MHVAAVLGGHGVAGDLGGHALAGDPEIERGVVAQPALVHVEATAAVQGRGAQKVEQRKQRLPVEHGMRQARLEPALPRGRQAGMQGDRVGGEAAEALIRRVALHVGLWRALARGGGPAAALDRDLDGVAPQHVAAVMAGTPGQRLRGDDRVDA